MSDFHKRLTNRLKKIVISEEDKKILRVLLYDVMFKKKDESEIQKRTKDFNGASVKRVMDAYKECIIGALIETVEDLESRVRQLESKKPKT
jgi:hypothetical protein